MGAGLLHARFWGRVIWWCPPCAGTRIPPAGWLLALLGGQSRPAVANAGWARLSGLGGAPWCWRWGEAESSPGCRGHAPGGAPRQEVSRDGCGMREEISAG
jgi:hypothetical protein